MAIPLIQSAFSAGEISPELYGEVTLDKFRSAATTVRNFIINYKGGLLSRPGLAFIGRCRQSWHGSGPPRAIPYQFSNNQGYILEMGDNYMRFVFEGGYVLEDPVAITGVTQADPAVVSLSGTPFNDGDWVVAAGVLGMTQLNGNTYIVNGVTSGSLELEDLNGNPVNSTLFSPYTSGGSLSRIYTISTPYLAEDLPYLKFAQSADVMSFTLSNPVTDNEYPPYDLTRFAATDWTLNPSNFDQVINPPASVSAVSNMQAPSNGVNASFAYQVTAVDSKGNESIASATATCHGADLQVEAGSNTLTWPAVPGATYYNVYRAPVSTDGTNPVPVPAGSIFGFVGSSYGGQFTDNNTTPDLAQTPPTHQNPFAPGQIEAVNITGGGSALSAATFTITTSTGSGFTGTPVLSTLNNGESSFFGNAGTLTAFLITDGGKNYEPGDSISFSGAGFATGAINFGSTNPTAGDTVTLNGVVFTFVSTPTGNNQAIVGGTLAASLSSLLAAVATSSNGAVTVANYAVDSAGQNLLISYKTAGPAGNSYTLAASRATPSGGTLTGGSGSGTAGSTATGSITFTVNLTNTQTIVLNGVTWTFVTSGATGNQTNIGASLSATMTALAANLNASVVPALTVAVYTATATAIDVAYKTVGGIGNTYSLGAGTSGGTASGASLQGGTDGSTVPSATLTVGPNFGTYPGVNSYFQQRHFFGNSFNNPDTIWATQTGRYNSFDISTPTIATDAITASPWTDQINGIQWLVPMPGGLIALTGLRAWQILGEGSYQLNAQAITPANLQAQPQAFNGCSATIPPIVIDYDVLYVQAVGNSSVFDLSWNFWVNIYTGNDLTILSSHLFEYRQISQWAWARQPYKVLWCACDDGTLLSLTYLKEQNVYGWARHDTDGIVVSVASITEPPVNAVYVITQRQFPDLAFKNYFMQAEENYTPAIAAAFAAGTQPNWCFCDKQNIGTSYDALGRNIMYVALVAAPAEDAKGQVLITNTTGQTLWDGLAATPPGNKLDLNKRFVLQIARKNIDTGVVTYFNAYNPASIVPPGIGAGGITGFTITGGSGHTNGTYENVGLTGGSGVLATATLTVSGTSLTGVQLLSIGGGYHVGDVLGTTLAGSTITVTSVNSGSDGTTWGRTVFDTSLTGGNVVNLVDPYTGNFWVHVESCEVHIFRPSTNFSMEISPMQPPFTPAENLDADGQLVGVTATWLYFATGHPEQLTDLLIRPSTIQSADRTADYLLATYDYTYPDGNTYFFRQCIGSDGNVYVYGAAQTGTRAYKLWKCVPGTGFSDVTPWSSSTGPNNNCAAYTLAQTQYPQWAQNYVIKLGASGNLVLISKLYPANKSGGTRADFRIDLTYHNIAGSTFDYHEGIVTGFMTNAWTPTVQATADWAVLDFQELNNYLDASDYVYPGTDYTKRWFMFVCQAYSGGSAVDGKQHVVFVEYQFAYGSAPTVVQVIPEDLWDNEPVYADYATQVHQSEIVAASLPTLANSSVSSNQNFFTDAFVADNGIYDQTTGAFWLSGDNPVFCYLNPSFASRYAQALNSQHTGTAAASSPFLKLSFGSSTGGSYIMERFDDRRWPTVEDAYCIDCAVSNPMTYPQAALNADSLSGAVLFSAMASVFTPAHVGQILRMSGGIAEITGFIDAGHVSGTWVLAGSPSQTTLPYTAAGDWSIALPVTTLHAPHLAGVTVSALADGVPLSGLVVAADGTITLPFAASNVKAGLPFTCQMQTPYLNGDSVLQGTRKAISAATVRIAASGPFEYGTNQPDGGAQNPQVLAPEWVGMVPANPVTPTDGQPGPQPYLSPAGKSVTPLWTGDLRVIGGDAMWITKGQIAVQQTLPLPMQVTAVMPEMLPGDAPDYQISPKPQQQPGAGGQGQEPPNGPGAWMLRGGRL